MGKMSPLYDGILLNCTITSDAHIDVKHPMPWLPMMMLKKSLKDAAGSVSHVNAYITVGDTTSRGQKENWELAKKCFDKYAEVSPILAVGNHDLWHDNDFDAAVGEYYKYYQLICSRKLTAPYFLEVINDYHFIFLGNDAESGCAAHISDEQFEWFKFEMSRAAQGGKPIFVFCHQSLNQKHGLPRTWDRHEDPNRPLDDGGIGARSEEIEAVLKSYKNVYYFSGHSHMGLCGEKTKEKEGYATFEQEDGLTLINLPSLSNGNHHGETNAIGLGVQLEVYADKVVIRPRNFKTRSWNKKITVKDGKPYWENSI